MKAFYTSLMVLFGIASIASMLGALIFASSGEASNSMVCLGLVLLCYLISSMAKTIVE